MPTKTMKYKITKEQSLYKHLKDVQRAVCRIKNKAVVMAWDWEQFEFSYQNRYGVSPQKKKTIGSSLRQDIYHEVKEWNKGFNSMFCDAAVKEAVDAFQRQRGNVTKGEETLLTYKKNGSFPLRAAQIRHIQRQRQGLYTADISLLAPDKAKELDRDTQWEMQLEARGSAGVIMDRIMQGIYELNDSKIQYSPKKKQFFLLVVYTFEKQSMTPNENRVMGIDLGYRVPATIHIHDISYSGRFVGNAKEVWSFENQMESRKSNWADPENGLVMEVVGVEPKQELSL